ncbi:hypothetical protein FIBSPDRAFT_350665 [Athelia psychrophila]|uniref:DUF6534 domain-containing protein n=1 Tax=Athelia psychrophila TaxID=1759441 RepID=A0A166PN60_9AGAM|nr:hypothetical protein FIBSPDRAFT_350665 [Fibularhizoctonia sp. CBS 109695]
MSNPANDALGSIFWGNTLAGGLYGILVMQVVMYFRQRRGVAERRFIKYMVGMLFLLDTTLTILGCVYLYHTLVLNFGNVDAVKIADWSFTPDGAFTGIIAGTVQLFYAWRVHVLVGKLYITVAIVIGALSGTALSIVASVDSMRVPQFSKWQKILEHPVAAWLAISACTDILFAVLLVRFLSKRKTGLAATDGVVDRVIRNTLQTGLLTAIVAITNMALFLTASNRSSLILNVPLSKVYNISFMTLLLHYGILGTNHLCSEQQDQQLTSITPYQPSYVYDMPGDSTEMQDLRNSHTRVYSKPLF